MANVIDKYKEWATDLIREDVQKHTFPYAVLMEQLQGDFNFGTVVRNANAFGAREVYYIGKKKYDRRSTVGTHHYTNVKYLDSFEGLLKLKDIYAFVGIDNIPGAIPLEDFSWPENPLLILGEEGFGLTPETVAICDLVVKISQYGSVRSLNAGTASGIVMHHFVSKLRNLNVQKEHS